MIEEIQKRPFVRPLFLWIAGTLLYVALPGYWPASFSLSLTLIICGIFFLLNRKEDGNPAYDTRWVWGAIFSFVVLSLSFGVSLYADRHNGSFEQQGVVSRWAVDRQRSFVESYDRLLLSPEEKSVLATLTLGYKKSMSKEVRARFSVAGVSHVLAVSGFHVAVVCGFFVFLLKVLPKGKGGQWIRYPVLLACLWTFVVITGLAASSVRAALMLSLYLTGNMLRRKADGYNVLAASAFCMLVYDPFYLFDIGFQLSYVAVLSIQYLNPRLKGLLEVKNPLLDTPWGMVTMTIAAQIGTASLCCYYFGQFSWVFLFTNLPVTFLATLLIPSALLWLGLPEWFPGYGLWQRWVELLVEMMTGVVGAFSDVPGAAVSLRFGLMEMLGSYSILVLTLLCIKMRSAKLLLAALSILLIMLVSILIERYSLGGN